MKILQINKYFYHKGGAETVFFNTIKLLEKNGHTVIPFSITNSKNEPTIYSKYFVNYPELSESSTIDKIKNTNSFFFNKESAKNLEKLILSEKPDIAHIHLMFNSLSVSILPILKKHNIPTVMSVHDYRLVCPAYTFTDGEGNFCELCKNEKFYHCILKKCSKKNFINSLMLSLDSYFRSFFYRPTDYINKFIFVSQFSMNKHIQISPIFKDCGTYLYNFTPAISEITKTKGKYLLFFGRLSEEKGIRTLIQTFKKATGLNLKIAGTGPMFDILKKECPPNVELLGFVKGQKLETLIREASFVIVPSECYENNPMTIIESYTIGTPIIGSDLGGIPELIITGKTGFKFKPKSVDSLYNAIQEAINISDEKYLDMVQNCRAFAQKNFSEEQHYNKLMEIYNSCLTK